MSGVGEHFFGRPDLAHNNYVASIAEGTTLTIKIYFSIKKQIAFFLDQVEASPGPDLALGPRGCVNYAIAQQGSIFNGMKKRPDKSFSHYSLVNSV